MTSSESTVEVDPNDAAASGAAFRVDGLALGSAAILTALIGMVGWMVAARTLEPAEVGRATAFVNGFLLIAGLSELGFSQAVIKWLPAGGRYRTVMVCRTYTICLTACVALGSAYAALAQVRLPGAGPFASEALFVVSAAAWMLFHVQDFVLTGIGAARWVPRENGVFGVMRLALLALLAPSMGALGIVLSWTISTVLWVVVVSVTLLVRSRAIGRSGGGSMPSRQEALKTTTSTYVSLLGMTLVASVPPVVVVARYGPALGAVFGIVWVGLNAIDYAAVGFGSALVVRLRGNALGMLRLAFRTVLPMAAVALAIAALMAPTLLGIFGREYADAGTALLRLSVVGALGRLVLILVTSIHLAKDRAPRMAVLHWISALVIVAIVCGSPVSDGLARIGLAFAVAQVVLAVVAVVDLSRCRDLRSEPAGAPRRTPLGASRP